MSTRARKMDTAYLSSMSTGLESNRFSGPSTIDRGYSSALRFPKFQTETEDDEPLGFRPFLRETEENASRTRPARARTTFEVPKAAELEGFCDCGAPLGVPHYCQANANRDRLRGPTVYNKSEYWAPNNRNPRPRPRPQPHPLPPPPMSPQPQMWSMPPQPQIWPLPPPPMLRPKVSPAPFEFRNKRAVLCGITYRNGPHALKGSVNDVLRMKSYLTENLGFHPDSIFVLRDDKNMNPKTIPTKANMIDAMKWLVKGCRPGDSLVFHFSGHGSRVVDDDMDEHDGFDEALCPVNYEDEGKIRDDTINDLLVRPLPRGAKLHAIIDTCYSGTVLDLPFMCRMNRVGQYIWEDHAIGKPVYKGTNGGLAICISACDDDGTSGDTSAFGMNGGALTHSFIQAMQNEPGLSYGRLLYGMRSTIRGAKEEIGLKPHQRFPTSHRQHYAHDPQLSCTEKFDIHSRPVVI